MKVEIITRQLSLQVAVDSRAFLEFFWAGGGGEGPVLNVVTGRHVELCTFVMSACRLCFLSSELSSRSLGKSVGIVAFNLEIHHDSDLAVPQNRLRNDPDTTKIHLMVAKPIEHLNQCMTDLTSPF